MVPLLMRTLAVALCSSLSVAQTFGRDWFPHPTTWFNVPSVVCGPGCPSGWPLTPGPTFNAYGSGKSQLLIPLASLPTTPSLLQDLAFMPLLLNEQFGIYHYGQLRVTLAQTPATTLSNNFAANLVHNPVVVLDRVDHYWTPNGHSVGHKWPAAIGCDVAYPFDPALGNLVVDIEAIDAAQIGGTGFYGFLRTTTPMVAAYGWSGTAPANGTTYGQSYSVIVMRDRANFEELGKPCRTSQNTLPFLFDQTFGVPSLGAVQRFDLVSGTPNAPAVMFAGTSLWSLDLASFGATGCTVHPAVEAAVPVSIDAAGELTWSFAIPANPSLLGARAWFQCAMIDPTANALGLVTSSYVRLLLGSS